MTLSWASRRALKSIDLPFECFHSQSSHQPECQNKLLCSSVVATLLSAKLFSRTCNRIDPEANSSIFLSKQSSCWNGQTVECIPHIFPRRVCYSLQLVCPLWQSYWPKLCIPENTEYHSRHFLITRSCLYSKYTQKYKTWRSSENNRKKVTCQNKVHVPSAKRLSSWREYSKGAH